MTTVANFDIATDLKVEMYYPNLGSYVFVLGVSALGGADLLMPTGIFILGESLLGGTDILETDSQKAFSWQSFEAATASAQIKVGGRVQSSLYFQPEAGTANLVMQSLAYDPTVNPWIRPGTPIRIRVDDGIINKTLFNGWIDTINVSYGAEGWNTINIAAADVWKRIMNSRAAVYDTTSFGSYATPLQAITQAVTAAGYTMSASSQPLPHKLPVVNQTNVIVNTPINDALKTGLGISWVDQLTSQVVVIPRPTIGTAPAGTWTVGNNHGQPYHLCMSDIKVAADGDVNYNSLRVENSNNTSQVVVKIDQDSIDLYGQMALDAAINTTDATELALWTDEVFSQSSARAVQEVQTPAIDRFGTLTDAAFFTPGTLIGVKYTKAPLAINDYYNITKVSHSITPDNWLTNLEVWRSF